MGKVYITQESYGKNMQPAKEFGELHVILTANESRRLDNDAMKRKLDKALKKFDPEEDFLLNTGAPHATGLAYAILLDNVGGLFRLLIWVRKKQEYVPSLCDVDW